VRSLWTFVAISAASPSSGDRDAWRGEDVRGHERTMGAFGTWAKAIARVMCVACAAIGVAAATGHANDGVVPAQYRLDPLRSGVAFDVKYLWHSRLAMRFGRMRAQLAGAENGLAAARVSVTIDAASLEANAPFLAGIVEGDEMLDAARYPSIRFVSTRFVRTGASSGLLEGQLTIRTTTRPVALVVTFDDTPRGASGDARPLAFSADGHFSRAAFGLSRWPAAVGDDVHMRIYVEFVRERTNP